MEWEFNIWLVVGGLFSGLLLGAVVQRSGFCMSAAVSNLVLMRDYRQFHAFLVAIAIALAGTQLLDITGLVDLQASIYLLSRINWSGALLGGLLFGFGTILAGGCIGRTLVRVGEGNISAILALLVMGITAAVTLYGPLEPLRVWLYQSTVLDVPVELASLPGLFHVSAADLTVLLVTVFLGVILFTGHNSYSPLLLFAGAIIGLLIVAGWWITGNLSQDLFSMHRPASLTYAGPLANSTYVLSTGAVLSEGTQFGLTLLGGTLAGSFLMAVLTGRFRWTLPERHHLCHIVIGGMLMGFGAILAGGCNIGNGLTGLSALSVRSLIAVIAIFAGMRLGVHWLMRTETIERERHWYSFIYRMAHH